MDTAGIQTWVLAQLQRISSLMYSSAGSKLWGRGDSGAGALEQIDLGAGLSMTGTTLSSTTVSHTHAGADVTSGTIDPARLGSGSGGVTKFLREDSSWQLPPSGSGNALIVDLVFTVGDNSASTAVVGQAWVAAGNVLVMSIRAASGEDELEPILNEIWVTSGNIVVGDGFTVYGYAPHGAVGTYKVQVVGV